MVNVRQLIAELTLLFGLEPFVTVAHKFGMGTYGVGATTSRPQISLEDRS